MSKHSKILIVENDFYWAAKFEEYLVGAGYRNITLANNKDGALSRLESQHLDVVILDLNLREIVQDSRKYEGIGIIRAIKDYPSNKRPKIIVVTGYYNQVPRALMKEHDIEYFFFFTWFRIF